MLKDGGIGSGVRQWIHNIYMAKNKKIRHTTILMESILVVDKYGNLLKSGSWAIRVSRVD